MEWFQAELYEARLLAVIVLTPDQPKWYSNKKQPPAFLVSESVEIKYGYNGSVIGFREIDVRAKSSGFVRQRFIMNFRLRKNGGEAAWRRYVIQHLSFAEVNQRISRGIGNICSRREP